MRSCVNRQLCPVTLEVVSSVLTAVHKMGHPDRCPARLGRKSILDQTCPRYVHHILFWDFILPNQLAISCDAAWCLLHGFPELGAAFPIAAAVCRVPLLSVCVHSRSGFLRRMHLRTLENWPPPQAFAPPRRQCPSEKERCAALHRARQKPRQKPTLALQMTSSQRLKQLPSGQPGTAHDYSCHFHWAHLEIG